MYLEHIDELTKDDFFNQGLYEEISTLPDGITQAAAITKLSNKAKELRIKGEFTTMVRAMKNDLRHRNFGIELDEETHFTILDNNNKLPASIAADMGHISGQLRCGNWICDDNGVRVRTDKGMREICPHPIFPVRILKNLETGRYKVEIVFQFRGQIQKIFVKREALASPAKIVELAAYAVVVKPSATQLLCEYFADMETLNPYIIKEFSSTSKLGWVRDGEKICFLPYDTAIVYDSESEFKTLYNSIRSVGSKEKWYNHVKSLRAMNRPELLINMAACFASVLAEPVDALPFIVSLWGPTGIGKSVVLKLCASIWANPDEGKFMADPKASATAIELKLDALNSLPMLLDDMAQIKNRDKDYSELIYYWCSTNGKQRANVNLGLNRPTTWRNCTLTNGERSLVDEFTQGGAINRVIDIECYEPLFDGAAGAKTVKLVSKNYGWAGEEFVDKIKEIGFDEVNKLYGEYYEAIKESADKEGVEKEDKQAMAMALILVADHLTEKHLFCDGVRIDIDIATKYLRNKGEISEVDTIYDLIMNEIQIHAINFADTPDDMTEIRECWGAWMPDNKFIAIYPKAFRDMLPDRNMEKMFLSWAKREGVIQYDKGSRNQKSIKVRGQTMKMYVIDTTYGQPELEYDIPFK